VADVGFVKRSVCCRDDFQIGAPLLDLVNNNSSPQGEFPGDEYFAHARPPPRTKPSRGVRGHPASTYNVRTPFVSVRRCPTIVEVPVRKTMSFLFRNLNTRARAIRVTGQRGESVNQPIDSGLAQSGRWNSSATGTRQRPCGRRAALCARLRTMPLPTLHLVRSYRLADGIMSAESSPHKIPDAEPIDMTPSYRVLNAC
jgi:hypothetical protein